MSVKKVFVGLALLTVMGIFFVAPLRMVEAAKLPVATQAPQCYPIYFLVEGYWGMSCTDPNNDIVSAQLSTNSSNATLNWDNTYAEFIVELEEGTTILWSVCDGAGSCAQGFYK